MSYTNCVYIMTNQRKSVLYTGVTSNLSRRVWEHKNKLNNHSFTKQYNCDQLIYYEVHEDIRDAINREKQIKGGCRQKKIDLINSKNPDWKDLFNELV